MDEKKEISEKAQSWIEFCLSLPRLEERRRCLKEVLRKQTKELLEIKEKWKQKSVDVEAIHRVLCEVIEEIREEESREVMEGELVVCIEPQEVKIIEV